jgi:hypothetical protein
MELAVQTDTNRQIYDLPPAPEPWIRLHQVAASASLAAGALAYTMTHISGKAATSAAANSVRVGGAILVHAGRLLGGDLVGLGIQTGVRTTAYVIETAGESATMMGALLASTVAAVTVGSSFLVGNTLYDIYKNSVLARPLPEMPISLIESIEEVDSEYVVYQLEDKPTVRMDVQMDMEAVD